MRSACLELPVQHADLAGRECMEPDRWPESHVSRQQWRRRL